MCQYSFILHTKNMLKLFDFDQNIRSLNVKEKNILHIEYPVFHSSNTGEITQSNCSNIFEHRLIRNKFTDNKICIVICSKNNELVIKHVLSILSKYNVHKKYDILLVDDRSDSDCILNLSNKYNLSYLRIDNQNDTFNYSIINNIAACYLKKLGKEYVIFYNNDLWPTSEHTIDNLIKKHINLGSSITGCKLLYPKKEEYNTIGKPTHVLGDHLTSAYNTIQHGGILFAYRPSTINNSSLVLSPFHAWRFYEPDTTMASIDSQCFAVTGAIHIMNIDTFIDLGGLSVYFSTVFQDIDLCLRAFQKKLSIFYIGSETMIHAESLTLATQKQQHDRTILQDNTLWDLVWANKLFDLLGMFKSTNA